MMESGTSASGSSGAIQIATSQSGTHGISGDVDIKTGNAYGAQSGRIKVQSGSSTNGAGGNIGMFFD